MQPKGIWLDATRFHHFAQPRSRLSEQIATRDRSLDYLGMSLVLPNPDPILKARGEDIRVYRELRGDAHLGGCVRRRKSAVKALEWGLDRDKAKSRIARSVEAILADLPLERIIGEILDAPLFGYQPLEIVWRKVGALVVPVDLVGKPQEWFCFDTDNQLRFKTRDKPYEGEPLPDRKFILARQDATYANPYGFPDLSMCFWPLAFKKGGVRFWVNFAERYGTPWAVGKLPRGAPQGDIEALADQLQDMVQDAVGVIPDDGSVEIVEAAGKAASADLYERLVMWARSEVAIALTGTNQTTEANSNRASATAGLEVADDLRDGDAGIVAEAINQLIRWTCDINWAGADRPLWSLWDQEARDVTRASRDETVSRAGAKLTAAYFERAYRYQPGDIHHDAAPPPPAPGAQFADGGATADERITPEQAVIERGIDETLPGFESPIDPALIREAILGATDPADLDAKLAALLADVPQARAIEVAERALAAAQLLGWLHAD